MSARVRRFVQMVSSAVAAQALLSAASFVASLMLIRRASDLQYGYYVLVANGLLLVTSLQTAFMQTPLVLGMSGAHSDARRNLVGGLHRDQRRWLAPLALCGAALAFILWATGRLQREAAAVFAMAALTAGAALYREFFRMVLLAYRRPLQLLWSDGSYSFLLLCGVGVATLTPAPAVAAVAALGVAALVGGLMASRLLWRAEPWNRASLPGALRSVAPLGLWTASGAAIHWLFSQGYSYMLAGTLDVTAIAGVAASRTLLMPVNLMSTGIASLLLPTASSWLRHHGADVVLNRLLSLAALLSVATLAYVALLWWQRDWIFVHVLHKNFAQRDMLLVLWSLVFLLMLLRDQLIQLPLASGRVQSLTALTACCAGCALTTSYLAIREIGAGGAVVGVLVGELLNVSGLLVLSLREARQSALPASPAL